MKLNKGNKHKGKVHPSPSSSSSTSNDTVSNLNKLLPPTILTLITVLSLQDKEVLAYMLSHSLSSSSSSVNNNNNNKSSKSKGLHKTPTFDCGCFDCYTSYWFLWDSSPHRELIHHALEAFEEHLSTSDLPTKSTPYSSSRRKHTINKVQTFEQTSTSLFTEVKPPVFTAVKEEKEEVKEEDVGSTVNAGDDVEVKEEGGAHENNVINNNKKKKKMVQQQQNKGLARKVLPDVIGLFNSRLWSLWGPNV